MVLYIITNRIDIIGQKVSDEGFAFHLKNLIYTLDQAKDFILKFSIDQESTISELKGVVNQFAFTDDFKEQMDKSKSNIIETMVNLCFYAMLSPTTEISAQLKDILDNPFTVDYADIDSHISRIPELCREWLIKKMIDWKDDPKGSKIFFLQADAGSVTTIIFFLIVIYF